MQKFHLDPLLAEFPTVPEVLNLAQNIPVAPLCFVVPSICSMGRCACWKVELDFKAECNAGDCIESSSCKVSGGEGSSHETVVLHSLQKCNGSNCVELIRLRSRWIRIWLSFIMFLQPEVYFSVICEISVYKVQVTVACDPFVYSPHPFVTISARIKLILYDTNVPEFFEISLSTLLNG